MAKDKDNSSETSTPTEQRTAFERVQLARHANRPYTLDLIERLFEDFVELHGDKRFAEDPAIVCGLARFHGLPVVVVGHQKGRDTKQRSYRNFGMPKPEGYRKALRLMRLGEKFGRPIFTFIDTPGAYPGIDAEERGQAEAIAFNLREMAKIKVPIIVALAIRYSCSRTRSIPSSVLKGAPRYCGKIHPEPTRQRRACA
jgi:acetyl-CoA carboxylase carboxyl transferase subunit alpha